MTTLTAPTSERSQLKVEQIIRAAMELVEQDGIDRLTIRALAARLGVAAGAVYYYVDSKEDLLQRIGQAIVDATPLPPPGPWRVALRDHIKATITTFSRFPGSDALTGSAEPWRRTSSKRLDHLQTVLTDAGITGDEQRQAIFTIFLFISGALRIVEVRRRNGETGAFADSAELDGALDILIAGLIASRSLGGEAV